MPRMKSWLPLYHGVRAKVDKQTNKHSNIVQHTTEDIKTHHPSFFPITILPLSFHNKQKLTMADQCNNINSSSQHPSVCCVHNTETQPLLGHHHGHHASGSQYQHQAPPPAYYVDMRGNNNKDGCYTPSNVHHQCKLSYAFFLPLRKWISPLSPLT